VSPPFLPAPAIAVSSHIGSVRAASTAFAAAAAGGVTSNQDFAVEDRKATQTIYTDSKW
jgi:hypothetical protein